MSLNKPELISIIPARGGSRGIPGKNLAPLNGKPLIWHTITASLSSRHIQRTVVSTDDDKIATVAAGAGAEVVRRPASLAMDDTPTEPVIRHVIEHLADTERCTPLNVTLLQPTSPLRTAEDIDGAYDLFLSARADSLLSVNASHDFLWRTENGSGVPVNYDYRKRPQRQNIEQYRENGAIYIFSTKIFLAGDNRLGGKIVLYEMDTERSIDIDTPPDLFIAEEFLHKKVREPGAKSVKQVKD